MLAVRKRDSVRLILNVSSRELMYDERARSTPGIGHADSAGILNVVYLFVLCRRYEATLLPSISVNFQDLVMICDGDGWSRFDSCRVWAGCRVVVQSHMEGERNRVQSEATS